MANIDHIYQSKEVFKINSSYDDGDNIDAYVIYKGTIHEKHPRIEENASCDATMYVAMDDDDNIQV